MGPGAMTAVWRGLVSVSAACSGPETLAMVPMEWPPEEKRRVPSFRSSVSVISRWPSTNVNMGPAFPLWRAVLPRTGLATACQLARLDTWKYRPLTYT
jgi:hypothetical protein